MKSIVSCLLCTISLLYMNSLKAECISGPMEFTNVTQIDVTNNQAAVESTIANAILSGFGTNVTVTITSVTTNPSGAVIVDLEIGGATTPLTPAQAAPINFVFGFNSNVVPGDALRNSGIPGFANVMVPSFGGTILTGVCPSQVQPVPTLSQWGLILFALLLLNFGAVVIFYRSKKVQPS